MSAVSIEANPPPRPPQLSPDHKWVWDGGEWRPLAVHQAVFPNWSAVGAGLPPEATEEARPVASPPPATPSPAAVYSAPTPHPQAAIPLWKQQRPRGINKTLYVVAGVIALIVMAFVVNALGPVSLAGHATPAARGTPKPSPPLTLGSDSMRADHFVNAVIAAPMDDLNQSLILVGETCVGSLTSSCVDALYTTDNRISALLSTIDHETVPFCIAANVSQYRSDLVKVDAGVQLALKGVKDARNTEQAGGLSQVRSANNQLQADYAALRSAAKSACDTPPAGP